VYAHNSTAIISPTLFEIEPRSAGALPSIM
jgi:hypothetical protein